MTITAILCCTSPEDELEIALDDMCDREKVSLSTLLSRIEKSRGRLSFENAMWKFVIGYYRDAAHRGIPALRN